MNDYKEYTVRVFDDGTKYWYLNDKLHREDDGPAIERSDGTKEWWLHNKLHRKNGPTIEHPDGTKRWFLNGKHHREDGPAVERANGSKEWWWHGEKLTEEEFNRKTKPCTGKVVEIDGKNIV